MRVSSFNLVAPLYDLGIWFIALFLGGEERLRAKTVDMIVSPSGMNGAVMEGTKVLELLCGTASVSEDAARRGAVVTGVDLSSGMLGVAREKFAAKALSGEFVLADAARLPFGDNSFDAVVVALGLHEIEAEERSKVLEETARVLRDGGVFVMFDFHRASGIVGFIQKVLFYLVEEASAWTWLEADIQGLLREKGFKNFSRVFLAGGALQIIRVER